VEPSLSLLSLTNLQIVGPLAALMAEFPGARYLVFGWGARDYYTAPNPGIGDILRALAPGPAVMLVIPLQMSPEVFFGGSNVVVIHVASSLMQVRSRRPSRGLNRAT
jgi:hypothetical protein